MNEAYSPPSGEAHARPCRPRPAACRSAQTTRPSSTSDSRNSFAVSLVDSTASKWRMVRPTILRFASRTSPIFNASRTSAEIFQRARQEAVCAGEGLATFAKSWLRRKPSNITAIPTSSPTYKAQEMLNRARDPPAAIISAPIPIHKLNDSRDRQYEYAATPIRATLPGTVNRGEKIRTLSGSAVPATGIAEASASVLTVAPATQPLRQHEGGERETDYRGAERNRGALETHRPRTPGRLG